MFNDDGSFARYYWHDEIPMDDLPDNMKLVNVSEVDDLLPGQIHEEFTEIKGKEFIIKKKAKEQDPDKVRKEIVTVEMIDELASKKIKSKLKGHTFKKILEFRKELVENPERLEQIDNMFNDAQGILETRERLKALLAEGNLPKNWRKEFND